MKLLSGYMEELSPLVDVSSFISAILDVVGRDAIALGGAVDQLQDERPASNDAGASG